MSGGTTVDARPWFFEEVQAQANSQPQLVWNDPQGVEVFKNLTLWQTAVAKRLNEFKSLAPNWDSYGGVVPTKAALLAAEDFVFHAPSFADIPVPRVLPLGSGGVQFEWDRNLRELEVQFQEDGKVSYLKTEAEHVEDSQPLTGNRMTNIAALLSWLISG